MNTRKFLLYQLSAAQSQVDMLKSLIAEEGAESPEDMPPVKEDAGEPVNATKKTKGKAKAKPEVEPEETEEVSETSDDDDMFGDDEEADNTPTLEDVRKAVKNFATKHGKEKTLKLLGKWKVTAINDLKKADYGKVIELAQKHT